MKYFNSCDAAEIIAFSFSQYQLIDAVPANLSFKQFNEVKMSLRNLTKNGSIGHNPDTLPRAVIDMNPAELFVESMLAQPKRSWQSQAILPSSLTESIYTDSAEITYKIRAENDAGEFMRLSHLSYSIANPYELDFLFIGNNRFINQSIDRFMDTSFMSAPRKQTKKQIIGASMYSVLN